MTGLIFILCFYSFLSENSADIELSTINPICTDMTNNDCLAKLGDCQEKCGCDGIFIYDKTKDECILNIEHLREMTRTKDHISADHDVINDEGLAKRLRETNDRVFKGLIGSAIFVICCATACVISVCIFCCHIHYSDSKLKNEVKALSEKMNRYDKAGLLKKQPKKPLDKIEESCNVVVADTDIMCV